ncbi:MAG: hypothetical protein C7B45_05685 [Sulfobacillus acidophilus]|uniref:Glycosyltransferase RgtA/B/C/D-like domain-containing protein n=1 Tax=Sulfobacillus acidophilus TaxID=53633 RepID=A0A2T2WKE3_9FIRM|nr:MAG: hypothetical protein C7B45_05685 [Sulfobacillus acidophilus]
MSAATVLHYPDEVKTQSSLVATSKPKRTGLWIAGISFVVYILAAAYLTFVIHYAAGDAVSRVANAYYVLFSRDPHLGAVGFVWNPLPSILELPIVALHPWIPAVVTRGLAGFVVSAVLGATGVYNLYRILERNLDLPQSLVVAITIIYALNPLIILYGANGMSDIMWIACILGTYSGLLDFLQTGSLRRLVSAAFWLAAGFGMRYESIPFGFMLILAIALSLWGRESISKWTGAAIIFAAPIVFSAGVWIYFNWLIMKNPLYFLDSAYSNLAQTATGAYMTPAIAAADHHPLGALLYVVRFGLLFWPIYPAMAFALWFCWGKHRDPRAIVLVFGTIGAELLELTLVYKGSLGEWDRYFMEFIPNGVLLLAFAIAKLRPTVSRWPSAIKVTLATLVVLLFLSGSVGTYVATQRPVMGHPDGAVLKTAFAREPVTGSVNNPFYGINDVVAYANAHPHMKILADTFIDWPVVIRVKHLNQFIITSDYDFNSILYNPRGRASAFLVPEPSGVAQLDAINRAWPKMWEGKVPWAQLIKSFPGPTNYRLYKILPSAP